MTIIKSTITSSTFMLALLCFFLPFFTFSCKDTAPATRPASGGVALRPIAETSGFHLIFGAPVSSIVVSGTASPSGERLVAEPLAAAAAIFIVLGVGLSFVSGKTGGFMGIAAGLLALASLIFLSMRVDGVWLEDHWVDATGSSLGARFTRLSSSIAVSGSSSRPSPPPATAPFTRPAGYISSFVVTRSYGFFVCMAMLGIATSMSVWKCKRNRALSTRGAYPIDPESVKPPA